MSGALKPELKITAQITGVGPRGVQGEKGEPGNDGYTPVKGIDYFDGEKGDKGDIGLTGYTPVKGVDYLTEAEKAAMLAPINSQLADIESQFDIAVAEMQSDAEVVLARGGKTTLKERLDINDATLSENVNDLTNCFPKKVLVGTFINIPDGKASHVQSISSTGATDEIIVMGSNIFDGVLEENTIIGLSGENAVQSGRRRCKNYIMVEPNRCYFVSVNNLNTPLNFVAYDSSKQFIGYIGQKIGTFSTPKNCRYIRFFSDYTSIPSLFANIMISFNSASFEAYNASQYSYPGIMPKIKTGVCNIASINGNTITVSIVGNSLKLVLPKKITAVVGKELNIYNQSIISDRAEKYIFKWECSNNSIFSQLDECIRITPTTTGSYVVTAKIYHQDELVSAVSTTLSAIASATKSVKFIAIGDSFIDVGVLPEFLSSEYGYVSIGSRTTGGINHEGRSGWKSGDYTTLAERSGVTNPFFNSNTNKFDFSKYMADKGYTGVTHVFINLGTNDSAYDIASSDFISNIDNIVNSIHTYDANIKIGIITPIQPSLLNDGWGSINKTSMTRWEYTKIILTYIAEIVEREWGTNVYIIPAFCNVDSLYDFSMSSVAVSARNPATVYRSIDNVHPNIYGFYKIADVVHYETLKN